MRCRSSVEDPRAVALLRHLVEGGDETRLVPCAHHGRAWCRVAGGLGAGVDTYGGAKAV